MSSRRNTSGKGPVTRAVVSVISAALLIFAGSVMVGATPAQAFRRNP